MDKSIVIMDTSFDTYIKDLPEFGRRYGHNSVKLNHEQIKALQSGKTLAVDVLKEYVLFIQYDNNVMRDIAKYGQI